MEKDYDPTLTLIYLPHLDYCLQRFGNDLSKISADLREIDQVCANLIQFYQDRNARILVLSEYGMTNVSQPIHLNRLLREQDLLKVREEEGRELLDAGASIAFCVADHQIAHIYVNDSDYLSKVRSLVEETPGVAQVLDEKGKETYHLNHERSGELIAISEPDAWFTYYYWLDDHRAPDFARTVDIHRKPGYDPVELFIDPQLPFPKLKAGLTLLKKKLGFRYLMDLIPLDASLVKGSHGCINLPTETQPLCITQTNHLLDSKTIDATEIYSLMLKHLFDN